MKLWFVVEDGSEEIVGPFESKDDALDWAMRNPYYYGATYSKRQVVFWTPAPNVEGWRDGS